MIKEIISTIDWLLFFHFVGIIIGLGAVIVIDTMGFLARTSKSKTQETLATHHTTKPLIWIGVSIITITWIFILIKKGFGEIETIKTILLGIMILNGSFLSFYISPRLDKLIGKKVLLSKKLQTKITISLIVSFISWWSFVILTLSSL